MSEENALAAEAIESPVTEDAAPQAEIEAGSATEQATEKAEKKSRAKERIQELVADKRAAIEYGELQRQRAEQLEQKLKSVSTPAETKTRPVLKDYETPEAWADAVTDWASEQAASRATKHVEKALSERESKTTAQQRHESLQGSMNAAAAKHEDFWEVVQDPTLPLTQQVIEVLEDFDNPGELAYQLALNPAETRKIAAMSPTRMAAALSRLEASMNTPKPTPKPKVTEAPEPPKPIGGGSAREPDLSKMTTEEYIKHRRAVRAS